MGGDPRHRNGVWVVRRTPGDSLPLKKRGRRRGRRLLRLASRSFQIETGHTRPADRRLTVLEKGGESSGPVVDPLTTTRGTTHWSSPRPIT